MNKLLLHLEEVDNLDEDGHYITVREDNHDVDDMFKVYDGLIIVDGKAPENAKEFCHFMKSIGGFNRIKIYKLPDNVSGAHI